jgi:hypothetical protein
VYLVLRACGQNMPIKYIGRTTTFKGKTLWEIVGNLKNFGVGRIVVRSTFERYPEPSYLKICKVEGLANEVCYVHWGRMQFVRCADITATLLNYMGI